MPIITPADLEDHLKPGGITGTQHDIAILNAVNASIGAVVQFCGRSFEKVAVASETARVYSALDAADRIHGIRNEREAVIHDVWDTTNLVVKTDEGDDGTYETTWSSNDYQLEPLNQLDGDSYTPYWRIRAVESRLFPTTHHRAALQVTAAWGWTAVPAEVKEAALIKAARLFHRRESPQGVAGFGDFGVVRISRQEDPDVASLLDPFVHPAKTATFA